MAKNEQIYFPKASVANMEEQKILVLPRYSYLASFCKSKNPQFSIPGTHMYAGVCS